jgi:hypothetical protein
MNIDAAWLFVSLAIGAVGTGLFLYGKKQARWPQLVCGVILCIYPYFVSNIWVMLGIALALIAALWFLIRIQQ